MTSRRGFTLVGILAAVAIPNYISVQARAKEARVHWNAHSLQMAAEDFAAQNGGVYAADFSTALPSGTVVTDLIPLPLVNPFDPAAAATLDAAPVNAGEVGYDTAGRVGIGYQIVGLGRNAAVVTSLTNGS